MRLKRIQLTNWQSFSKIDLECRNFLVFVGESNTGKSSMMKAIMYFFQARNLREEDLRHPELPLEITASFTREDGKPFSLRLLKKPKEAEEYYRNDGGEWIEIPAKEYHALVSEMDVFYLPSWIEGDYIAYLFEKLMQREKMKKYSHFYEQYRLGKQEKASYGYYRHLVLYLLQEMLEEEKERNFWKNTILLWEEPEFYLTPQEQRACYDIVLAHSQLGLQAMISTNSSRFIELEEYKSLCLFRKKKEDIKIFQYQGNLFSGNEITEFNMNYWINPDRSEIFFAKKVVLVEGQTDKMVLSYLAKQLGVYHYDISIVECGSKGVIPQFIRMLNSFCIPYVVVYDKDNHFWRSELELEHSNQRNLQIQRRINPKLGHWVEFENDIEEEIYQEDRERRNYKNKPFYALEKVMRKNYVIPESLEKKVKEIYRPDIPKYRNPLYIEGKVYEDEVPRKRVEEKGRAKKNTKKKKKYRGKYRNKKKVKANKNGKK